MITNLKKLKKLNKEPPNYKKLYYGALRQLNQTTEELDRVKSENSKLIENQSMCSNAVKRSFGAIDYLQEQNDRYRQYEADFNKLQGSLIGCLSIDELEAAQVTGCPQEVYAVELLKIFQEWKKTNRLSHEYGRDRAQH